MPVDNAHSVLVEKCLLVCGQNFEVCRVWKNSTGTGYTVGSVKQFMKTHNKRDLRLIRFGKKGSPDIIGFLKDGRFLGIECKTGNARQSKDQKNFEKITLLHNGVYLTIRDEKKLDYYLKNILTF